MTADEAPVEIDWSDEADQLSAAATDDAAWYAQMAATLVRPADRVAADIGCGAAGMALALRAALPAEATVIGVDGDSDILDAARRTVATAGVGDDQITLVRADLHHDLAVLRDLVRGADIVWAAGSIHHVGDQQAAIELLAGLLSPSGRLALAEGGLTGRHLPWDLGVGEPGLEARLVSAEERWFARMRASLHGSVRMPYGWSTALRRAGLVGVTTRTTLFEAAPAPGTPELAALIGKFGHRIERVADSGELDDADLTAWTRLVDPADDAWLGHRDDVHSLSVRCVHIGQAPAA